MVHGSERRHSPPREVLRYCKVSWSASAASLHYLVGQSDATSTPASMPAVTAFCGCVTGVRVI